MGAVLPPLPEAFCSASEIPSGPQGSKRAGAVIWSGAHAGGQWQRVQAEQPQLEPPSQARPPLSRKRNNNPELAKNDFFPYKKGGTFPHSQKSPSWKCCWQGGAWGGRRTPARRKGKVGWLTVGRAAVGNCGHLIRGRAKNSHASATAPQSDRSPQYCGDICTDTEQTDTALPVDKMVISSHLTVTKHFLLHSSMLLSNESLAALW